MADPKYPVVMIGGVPVVDAPQEIDAANAEGFRKILLRAACCGHPSVVVNMTGTRFCDSSGIQVLVGAHNRAVAEGGELLLVIPASSFVRRAFAFGGIDRLIPDFADVNVALEQAQAVLRRPLQRHATPGMRTEQTGSPGVPDARRPPLDSPGALPERPDRRGDLCPNGKWPLARAMVFPGAQTDFGHVCAPRGKDEKDQGRRHHGDGSGTHGGAEKG